MQFIHWLNDSDMLAEIFRELTTAVESKGMTSEQVFIWAKIMDALRAQSTIITSLDETKESDKIKTLKEGQRHNLKKLQTHAKTPPKQSCSYFGSSHPSRQCPAYGKNCAECGMVNHFRKVCRSRRNKAIHYLEQEPVQHHKEKDHIDTVNINSIIFNSKWLVRTGNLKTSSNKVSITVPYKVDTGSDGNIMPLHLHKRLFLVQQKNNWKQ